MTKRQTFKAIIQNAGGGGAFVEVPFDVERFFGSKRPKVKAMIEGVSYRGTLGKKDETRQMRVLQTLELLKERKKSG